MGRFKNHLLIIISFTIQENSAQQVKCVCVFLLLLAKIVYSEKYLPKRIFQDHGTLNFWTHCIKVCFKIKILNKFLPEVGFKKIFFFIL